MAKRRRKLTRPVRWKVVKEEIRFAVHSLAVELRELVIAVQDLRRALPEAEERIRERIRAAAAKEVPLGPPEAHPWGHD